MPRKQAKPRVQLVRDGKTFDSNGRRIRVGSIVAEPGPGRSTVGRVVAVERGVLLYRSFPSAGSRNAANEATVYSDACEVTVLDDPDPMPDAPSLTPLSREAIHVALRLADVVADLELAEWVSGPGDFSDRVQGAIEHVRQGVADLWMLALSAVGPPTASPKLANAIEQAENPVDGDKSAAEEQKPGGRRQ